MLLEALFTTDRIFITAWGILTVAVTSYVAKRMKDMATRTDLKELTRDVEEIKASLHVKAKAQESFHQDLKIAVIETYERLWQMVYSIEVSVREYGGITDEKVREMSFQCDALMDKFNESLGRLELYIGNDEIIEKLKKAVRMTSKLQTLVAVHLYGRTEYIFHIKRIKREIQRATQNGEEKAVSEAETELSALNEKHDANYVTSMNEISNIKRNLQEQMATIREVLLSKIKV